MPRSTLAPTLVVAVTVAAFAVLAALLQAILWSTDAWSRAALLLACCGSSLLVRWWIRWAGGWPDTSTLARRVATTEQYQRSMCERKKVEMLFAHMKRILRLDRLRLRGLSGARDEFTLAAAVQNLRRLAMLVPQGPPPQGTGAPV